jgi:hypothetical protein
VLKVLDASAADYSALVWRSDSADLAALRSKTNEKYDGPTQVALAWTSVGLPGEKAVTLDPTAGALPMSKRLVTIRRPSWLETGASDGPMILLGVADWTPKPPAPEGGRGGRGAAPPEKADVDVWHWNDSTVKSAPKLRVAAGRRRNLPLAARLHQSKPPGGRQAVAHGMSGLGSTRVVRFCVSSRRRGDEPDGMATGTQDGEV